VPVPKPLSLSTEALVLPLLLHLTRILIQEDQFLEMVVTPAVAVVVAVVDPTLTHHTTTRLLPLQVPDSLDPQSS
jgi:hypothetical protein